MKEKDTCSIFSAKLEEMQASHKLNPVAISTIDAIIGECKDREKFWVSNTEVPPQTAFVLYHASRNTRIIFEKMRNRFVRATKLHENPKVVYDTSAVFPELSEMCSLLDSLKKSEITQEMVDFLRRRVRSLRNTAEKAKMLPTITEEAKAVREKELARELKELAIHLKVNLI